MSNKNNTTSKKVGSIIGHALAILGGVLVMVFLGLFIMMWIFCHGPSTAAREMFTTTILETGALKFLASWYLTPDEIAEIVGKNSMVHTDEDVDTSLITIDTHDKTGDDTDEDAPSSSSQYAYEDGMSFDENGIAIQEIAGKSFKGILMLVKDPSQVVLSTIYPWADDKSGVNLDVLVNQKGAVAGINGGLYESDGNWGGRPKGLVVCNGEIQFNSVYPNDVMVGFNEDDILVIKDIGDMNADQVTAMVADERIRDAISFKDELGVDSNHFTKLIINGEPIQINGTGSGANPRTVVAQRGDGAVILLVTDGRGASGHIGATAADLIEILEEYGAVNAANIDGGSSSSMYYNGKYLQTSVTMYFSNASWNLPDGFVVMGK